MSTRIVSIAGLSHIYFQQAGIKRVATRPFWIRFIAQELKSLRAEKSRPDDCQIRIRLNASDAVLCPTPYSAIQRFEPADSGVLFGLFFVYYTATTLINTDFPLPHNLILAVAAVKTESSV